MLVVFGGLPGTGKTTIAEDVADRCQGVYLRIDTIEEAIRSAGVLADEIGPAGYLVAYALAETNLKLGRLVIADCVNPLPATRNAWRAVAKKAAAALLEIEVLCSDPVEHQRRVESRTVDISGLNPPTWRSVMQHEYAAWSEPRLILDTAQLDVPAAISLVVEKIATNQPR